MANSTNHERPILCYGEVLWDSLPHGLFPGGAPINVAYHLKQLGWRSIPVTAVGADFLGHELVRRLERWGLETAYVAVLSNKATGAVQVQLGPHGIPTYTILEDVAWDWLEMKPALLELAPRCAAIIYGTLAQRCEHNRQQLARLRKHAKGSRFIYDVNLRPPFDSPDLVWELARETDLIKLNHEELIRLLDERYDSAQLEEAARAFATRTGCPSVCVTAGPRGAGWLTGGAWHWEESRPVTVKDTIGAGDSFLAALVDGWLENALAAAEVLSRACRLAEYVASCDGATPAYRVTSEGRVMSAGAA